MFQETVANNYFGHLLVCETIFPLLAPSGCVINVASGAGRLGQVSSELQTTFSGAANIDTITDAMQLFVKTAQTNEHTKHGFSNSAYGMSKLGMISSGVVHAKELAAKNVSIHPSGLTCHFLFNAQLSKFNYTFVL